VISLENIKLCKRLRFVALKEEYRNFISENKFFG
jgi:hypothetical protein